MASSAAMIYYIKAAQSRLQNEESCLRYSEDEAGTSSGSDVRLYFFQKLSSQELIKKTDKSIYLDWITYSWLENQIFKHFWTFSVWKTKL